jgi:hypothetical protein
MTLIEIIICIAICAIIIAMAFGILSDRYKTGQKVVLNGNGDKGVIMSVLRDEVIRYSILVSEPRTYTIILSSSDFSLYEGVERE